MVRHCDFIEQASLSRRRADAASGHDREAARAGRTVVVDSKAPLQGLLDAYEAEREARLRDHARLLRTHIKQLGDKAY